MQKVLDEIFPASGQGGLLDCVIGASTVGGGDNLYHLLNKISMVYYNEFEGDAVGRFLDNAIGMFAAIRFGREYSPVLYLLPRDGVTISAVKQAIKKARLGHDELQQVGAWVRVWWD